MNNPDLLQYQNRLLDMRPRLEDEIHRSIDAVREEIHPVGEDSKGPSEGLDKELALEKTQEDILHAVDEALRRIEAGTFGVCQKCDTEIPKSRLEAIPYTSHCINCEELLERR